jgi:hypothetical protein
MRMPAFKTIWLDMLARGAPLSPPRWHWGWRGWRVAWNHCCTSPAKHQGQKLQPGCTRANFFPQFTCVLPLLPAPSRPHNSPTLLFTAPQKQPAPQRHSRVRAAMKPLLRPRYDMYGNIKRAASLSWRSVSLRNTRTRPALLPTSLTTPRWASLLFPPQGGPTWEQQKAVHPPQHSLTLMWGYRGSFAGS